MESSKPNPSCESWQRLNQLTDEQLVLELLGGNDDALIILFDRYHKIIFGVALRIVRDTGEAEDVVQTVFFDAYRGLANFDPAKGTLKVWLLQYGYSRALNRQRHLAAHRFYDLLDIENASKQLGSHAYANPCEISRLADELLSSLSQRRRTVIELTYAEGLTANEISERLKLNPATVRHELYRGLAKLRQAVKEVSRVENHKVESRGKEALTPNAQPF